MANPASMTNDEIRAIALEKAKEADAYCEAMHEKAVEEGCEPQMSYQQLRDIELCTRFLAAITEKADAVLWMCPDYGDVSKVQRVGWKPLFLHPAIEPAPQGRVKCRKCGKDTMHIGDICYRCAHEPAQPKGHYKDQLINELNNRTAPHQEACNCKTPSFCIGQGVCAKRVETAPPVGAARIGYMDATDYQHELGHCKVEIYATAEGVLDGRACASECGVVRVRVEQADGVSPVQITVEAAINQLVAALQDSKGWLRDYADSIIRDAIDRTSAPLSDDVKAMVDHLRDQFYDLGEDDYTQAADMIETQQARIAELEAESAELRAALYDEQSGITHSLRAAEIDALRVNAARYDFIRSGYVDIVEMPRYIRISTRSESWDAYDRDQFDAAIDAARGVK